MAVTYTLEEAAEKLGIPADEFRKRLKTEWKHLRPMRDGSTLRFKDKDVDELVRQIGLGSEEQLQLADPSSTEKVIPKDMGNIDDSDPSPIFKGPKSKAADDDAPLPLSDPIDLGGKDFVLVDDAPKGKTKSSSDSDVRLEKTTKPKSAGKKKDRDGTDEIELDVLPPSTSPSGKMISASSSTKLKGEKKGASSSGKLAPGGKSTGKSGKLSKPPVDDPDSSEFELTLDADSSDEFELSLATDSSDEIALGDPPPPAAKAGASGINLGKPIDSGINLEKKGDSSKRKGSDSGKRKGVPSKPDSDDEIEFELSLDQAGASSKKLGSGVSKKQSDSDSEFELTLDETSDLESASDPETANFTPAEQKNDIFETDFEIPALDDDSASEAVAIDEADTDLESSDFDLAIDEGDTGGGDDESASQVVVLDDETDEAPAAKPGKKKAAPAKSKKKSLVDDSDLELDEPDDGGVSFDEMEMDEDVSASRALKGAAAEHDEDEEEEDERVVVAQGASWGVFPALVLLPTVFVIFLGSIMAYELVHSMWGYQQPTKPSTLIINKVAEVFDLQPKE